MLKELLEAAKPPAKPRGGHFVETAKGELQKISTVSRGYAYVDVGRPMRDAIPISSLTYKRSQMGGKHIWTET